eukprot:2795582-Rhodomonas_salina.1
MRGRAFCRPSCPSLPSMFLETLLTSITVACNEQVKTQVNDLVGQGVGTLVTLFSPPREEAPTPTPDSQDKATISRLEEE